jgi:hypothetical protein
MGTPVQRSEIAGDHPHGDDHDEHGSGPREEHARRTAHLRPLPEADRPQSDRFAKDAVGSE